MKCVHCGRECDSYFETKSGRPLCMRCKIYYSKSSNELRYADEFEVEMINSLLNDSSNKRLNMNFNITGAYIRLHDTIKNIDLNKPYNGNKTRYLLYFYMPELNDFTFDIMYDADLNSFLCSSGKTKKYKTLLGCFVEMARQMKKIIKIRRN